MHRGLIVSEFVWGTVHRSRSTMVLKGVGGGENQYKLAGPDYVAYVFVFLRSIIICRYEPFETKPKIFTWSALAGGPKKLFCRGRTLSRRLWIEDHESRQNIVINSTPNHSHISECYRRIVVCNLHVLRSLPSCSLFRLYLL